MCGCIFHFVDNMDNVSKSNMFYRPEDAQVIQVEVNTKTSSFAHAPTPIVEASASMLEVDHLVDVAITLTLKELSSPPASTKGPMIRDNHLPGMRFLQSGLMGRG